PHEPVKGGGVHKAAHESFNPAARFAHEHDSGPVVDHHSVVAPQKFASQAGEKELAEGPSVNADDTRQILHGCLANHAGCAGVVRWRAMDRMRDFHRLPSGRRGGWTSPAYTR